MQRSLQALVGLCRAGRRELVTAFLEGRLGFAALWTAAEGAAACIAEIAAAGDAALVDETVAAARLEQECAACASLTRGAWGRYTPRAAERAMSPQGGDDVAPGETVVVRALYCGPRLEDRTHLRSGAPPTCGCLVGQEVGRAVGEQIVTLRVLPACATMLKAKQCPQQKW